MATSQNGWLLVDHTQLENLPIPGTDVKAVPGLLKGDVAWLLRWVGSEFNKRVDPLITPGCWGWNAPTPIPGSNIYSNHCSGTAIDLNAPHFPWTLKSMSARQREECRKIVNQTEGVVVWGGDFTTITDEMHFEVNGSKEDVKRIVAKLKGGDMTSQEQHDVGVAVYRAVLHREPENSEAAKAMGKRLESKDGSLTPASVIAGLNTIPKSTEWKEQNDKIKSKATNTLALKLDKSAVLDYVTKNLK